MSKTIKDHLLEQRKPVENDLIEVIEVEELDETMSLFGFVGMSTAKSPSGYKAIAFRDSSGKAAYPVMISKDLSTSMASDIVQAVKNIVKRKN